MDAASTCWGLPARLFALILLLCTVIVLAERDGAGQPRNNTRVRVVPMVPLTLAETETGFAGVERALSRLPIRAGERIQINAVVMSALTVAAGSMPATLHPEAVNRMEWLLHKGWPAPAAEELAQLLVQYHAFKQVENQVLAEPGATTVEADEARLAALRALQLRHFDPITARGLFGEHNALALYSLRLRLLDEDPARTESEKAAGRAALQRQYDLELQALRTAPGFVNK